jgi:hypothetical protein
MMGRRKTGKINHLLKLLDNHNISYNMKEIQELSCAELTKRIEGLGGVSEARKNCNESRGRIYENFSS